MKSLLSNSIQEILNSWSELNGTIKHFDSLDSYPKNIEGLQGASTSFFAASYIENIRNKRIYQLQYTATGRYSQEQQKQYDANDSTFLDTIIIVPTEKDATSLLSDFKTIFEDNIESYSLPWWGTVPYRAIGKGSAIFGQRAGVLSKLAWQNRKTTISTKPRVFIIPERAFLSPVPNPEYIRSLVFSIYKGQNIDPIELANKLTSLGYIRVPKVGVGGEFTLRGEVLDIFTPGESLATRIIFDFDEVG